METFLKIFLGFWIIWIIWYLTGGPYRDDKSKPYIGINNQGQLENFSTPTAK